MTAAPAPGPVTTPPPSAPHHPALLSMLEARSVALVGASSRPGSLGERMVTEALRSPARPRIHLVNARYRQIAGRTCHPSLADLPEPVDLVLLGVPDSALAGQLELAAARGDRSAVIFGGAYETTQATRGLRARLTSIAGSAGMAVCGAGCMGFVNVSYGLRAMGYLEPDPLPGGPVALVTASGSVFSALLRARRGLGYTIAVSSGQELLTPAAAYARYALSLPQTRVLGLVLEAIRDPERLRDVLAAAGVSGIPVVLLTAGSSAAGRELVTAHSGALAGSDAGWEALAEAYGVHRVHDLAELADTLELFAAGRRAIRCVPDAGIATVHDSGLERAHVADLADGLGVPFAAIGEATRRQLAGVLDPGLEPANPLDMWGTGRDTQAKLTESLVILAEDPAVAAVALTVDLVAEFDGDRSYPDAVLAAAQRTRKPVVVLAGIPASIDPAVAAELRDGGIPVLEGTRSGLVALRHMLTHAAHPADPAHPAGPARQADTETHPHIDLARQQRWSQTLRTGGISAVDVFGLLRDYGVATARTEAAEDLDGALTAAQDLGYPVVLKTAQPGLAHKSDAGGVVLSIADPASLAAAYTELATRLGPLVLVCEFVPPGTELALGITRDPDLGPLVVAGAGGVLVEFLADRVVALPPVGTAQARRLLGRLRAAALLAGARGQPPADVDAVAGALAAVSAIAVELSENLDALDINPLICGPSGAIAVDALLVRREPE